MPAAINQPSAVDGWLCVPPAAAGAVRLEAAPGAGAALGLVEAVARAAAQREPDPDPDPDSRPHPVAGDSLAQVQELTRELEKLLELDDCTNALNVAQRLLRIDPASQPALAGRTRCRARLLEMHEARCGGASAVPRIVMAANEIIWQDLDHRAGFVLSNIDGHCTCDEVALVTGLDRLEFFRILAHLVEAGIVAAASV